MLKAIGRLFRRATEDDVVADVVPHSGLTVDYTRKRWGHNTMGFRWLPATRKERRLIGSSLRARITGVGPLLDRRHRVGDDIIISMAGGPARFRITQVEYESDPPDYWHATIKSVGYVCPREAGAEMPAGPEEGK